MDKRRFSDVICFHRDTSFNQENCSIKTCSFQLKYSLWCTRQPSHPPPPNCSAFLIINPSNNRRQRCAKPTRVRHVKGKKQNALIKASDNFRSPP